MASKQRGGGGGLLWRCVLVGICATTTTTTTAAARHVCTFECDPFCGYSPILAGKDLLCIPGNSVKLTFPIQEDFREYCDLVASNRGCNNWCGYRWNSSAGRCRKGEGEGSSHDDKTPPSAVKSDPIIGGNGDYKYQFMPNLLKFPQGANPVNCHGLAIDANENIILTYQNDGSEDKNCLIKWNPDGTGGEFLTGGNTTLCDGTCHGLKITTESEGVQYLYHANNDQKLTKTTLDGTVVWQVNGFFGQNESLSYRPTWFATPPNSNYTYLCDGYGSNNVYSFDRRDGRWMNRTFGGPSPGSGPHQPHGLFSTNHGCTYDSRTERNTIIVSDRANSRLEFYEYDPQSPDMFSYANKSVDLTGALGPGTLPCNIRTYPEHEGIAIVPDLSGPVAILNKENIVVSVVNVSVLLADLDFKHPHDAIILPNGDFVVATWAPGRVGYWKRVNRTEGS